MSVICEITLRIGQSGKVALCISFLFIVFCLTVQKYTKNTKFQSLTFCQYTHLLVSNAENQRISKTTKPYPIALSPNIFAPYP